MTSDEILAQVLDLLKREGGWPIGRLSRRFNHDDDDLHELKAEFIQVPHR
jgi:hypothetical protein